MGVILGMLTWYWQKNKGWRAWALCGSTLFLLVFSIWVAIVSHSPIVKNDLENILSFGFIEGC